METNNTTELAEPLRLILRIQGLALCYFDEIESDGEPKKWRVFFPKVESHVFKLKVTKKNDDKIVSECVFALPAETKIKFLPTASKSPSTISDISDSIDISALHDEEITLTEDRSKYAGFLNLYGTSVATNGGEDGVFEFEIWDSRETTDNPPTKTWVKHGENKEEVAISFAAVFNLNASSVTEIKLENDEFQLSSSVLLNHGDNILYEITFTNDCEKNQCEEISDFKYFYNIIDRSKLDTNRSFELILIPDPDNRGRNGSCGGIGGGRLIIPSSVKF